MYPRAFQLYKRALFIGPRNLTAITPQIHRTLPRHIHSTPAIMSRVQTHESLTIVSTPHAPAAIGPYSQAIKVGDLLFLSGCIPLDPATGTIVGEGDVRKQSAQVFSNFKAVVEAGGSQLGKVVKTTVFLKSMNDFATVNELYAEFFGDHKPARSAVEVARLPKDVLVEMEAIVSLK